MKVAVLIVETEDGKVVAPTVASTVASVIEAARKVRDAGELGKKIVRRGVVLHSQKGVVFRFRC